MELQFHKNLLPGMQLMKREVRNLEETQELRLPDGMPDIGTVVGTWAQLLLRGKEWHGSSAQVSGGAMVCILYMPEEGSDVQKVETWMPFQAKWELPDTQTEGMICADALLRSVDARSISARKLMVRTNVGVMGEFWHNAEAWTYAPGDLPEDIAVLRRTYPVCIPKEAGEKPFVLEEELTFPAGAPKPVTLLRCHLQPELTDQKIMSDKVVFRGMLLAHTLYRGEDGKLHTWDFEVPFSQYNELTREYETDATARLMTALTSMEADLDPEGRLRLKVGMTGQYLICDRTTLETVEDAYSPRRAVTPQIQTLEFPVILDVQQQTVAAEQTVQAIGNAVDLSFLPDHPASVHMGAPMTITGQFQYLYRDDHDQLQTALQRWEQPCPVTAGEDTQLLTVVRPTGKPQAAFDGSATLLHADLLTEYAMLSSGGIPMVTALEVGDTAEADEGRPSLILRRAGKQSLWQIAKENGSTVEAIMEANQLESQPDADKMLLIPVL